jgi:phospholipase C
MKVKKPIPFLVYTAILLLVIISVVLVININHIGSTVSEASKLPKPPKVDHIVIIVDENRSLASLSGNPKAPYINEIMKSGSIATNYHAVTKNPYIALTSGSSTNISNTCNPEKIKCQTQVANITDEIELSGRTWKMYAESMPNTCGFKDTKNYAVRHNPFMYYPSISGDSAQCSSQIVPYSQLKIDINDSKLPNYVFISPNVCNDMHSCSTNTGDKWLSKNIPTILSSPEFTKQNSLLILTWDEGNQNDNRVLTVFLGSAAKQNFISNDTYNHYSILHTIEYLWDLKPLSGNDKNATVMEDMLK